MATPTNTDNIINYAIYTIERDGEEDVVIFLHEAEWVVHNGAIPDNYMVYHKDGNTSNNCITNLDLVEENKLYGDLSPCKVFHLSNYKSYKKLIEENFTDIYFKLFPV